MAFGNAAAERAAIERTYEDTASISRTVPETGVNKITKSVPAVVHDGVICALSYSSGDRSRQTQAQQDIDYDATIFATPELAILPGDTVQLKRFGRDNPNSTIILTFEVVGRPVIYATHQQIRVKDGDLS